MYPGRVSQAKYSYACVFKGLGNADASSDQELWALNTSPCTGVVGEAKSCKTGDEDVLGGAGLEGPASAWEDCTLCGLLA